MNGPVHVSVIVPAYNEERNIGETIRHIEAWQSLKGRVWEIMVVDDGSTDNTAAIAQDCVKTEGPCRVKLLRQEKNIGKGAAVRRGMMEATGEYLLMCDADLSMPIKESDKLIHALEFGADIAIGSRAIHKKGADVQQSVMRRISSRVFNGLVRLVAVRGIRDTQCGFKCFRKNVAREIFSAMKIDRFCFDVEMLYLAKKKGLKIAEVSVMWRQAEETRVRLFHDSFSMLGDLFKIRRMHSD